MPLTFRLVFHGLRSVWIAILLGLLAWLTLVPATRAEQAALGNSPLGATPFSLAQMRIARVAVHFAPERAAQMLSRATGGDISPELAGMLLRDMAGQPSGSGTQPTIQTTEQTTRFPQVETFPQIETLNPRRPSDGAKFVTVD